MPTPELSREVAPRPSPGISKNTEFAIGTRVGSRGRLELIEVIGRGGGGVVYLANDRRLDRVVALKTLSEEAEQTSRVRSDQILLEAKALAGLDHGYIVRVHEAGVW